MKRSPGAVRLNHKHDNIVSKHSLVHQRTDRRCDNYLDARRTIKTGNLSDKDAISTAWVDGHGHPSKGVSMSVLLFQTMSDLAQGDKCRH